jgi:hypothetical protein
MQTDTQRDTRTHKGTHKGTHTRTCKWTYNGHTKGHTKGHTRTTTCGVLGDVMLDGQPDVEHSMAKTNTHGEHTLAQTHAQTHTPRPVLCFLRGFGTPTQ